LENPDPTAEQRKKDHIEMAFDARISSENLDNRFNYDPVLSSHPKVSSDELKLHFLGKTLSVPIWISSMTGGTTWAATINKNLARLCADFGMGMGLGSCRSLLQDDTHFEDFNVRQIIGEHLPLYTNLGIAQLEELVENNDLEKVSTLVDKLQADGLIIHINPLQEWLQPEGDIIKHPPIDTIKRLIDVYKGKIIVKEVGQGMGKASLKALFQLPIEAVDLAANGGTNFAKLELMRSNDLLKDTYKSIANLGHGATEMVNFCNEINKELGDKRLCNQVIISGGVKGFLDGYYLMNKLSIPSVYGQASAFLRYARGDYDQLRQFAELQVNGLKLAKRFLTIKA
jgi:isopentenyl-diphosphate delta-isomerase